MHNVSCHHVLLHDIVVFQCDAQAPGGEDVDDLLQSAVIHIGSTS